MTEVGAYEAKTHFAQLLDRVARGETITITRRGTPIAEIRPVGQIDRQRAREATKALREFQATHPLGDDLTIRQLIDEGRRW
jgi:prevent-host-death family protein